MFQPSNILLLLSASYTPAWLLKNYYNPTLLYISMQTSINIVITAFLAFAIYTTGTGAIPIQGIATGSSLVARTDAVCNSHNSIIFNDWDITIPSDDRFDGDRCGSGFLDNLRGQCGIITRWECDRNGADATLKFETTRMCELTRVNAAIYAASRGLYENLCTGA